MRRRVSLFVMWSESCRTTKVEKWSHLQFHFSHKASSRINHWSRLLLCSLTQFHMLSYFLFPHYQTSLFSLSFHNHKTASQSNFSSFLGNQWESFKTSFAATKWCLIESLKLMFSRIDFTQTLVCYKVISTCFYPNLSLSKT